MATKAALPQTAKKRIRKVFADQGLGDYLKE